MKKRILIIIGLVVMLVTGGLAFGGNYLVTYALFRKGAGGGRSSSLKSAPLTEIGAIMKTNTELQKSRTDLFLSEHPEEAVSIVSDDGLKLNGGLFEQEDSHLWVIEIHGYRSNHKGRLDFVERFFSEGYNVLAPDLRGSGDSEGDYIGMGWPDRLDILKWIDWIIERDPSSKIVLHGGSMGGAAVMMTAGEKTPDNVICFIEDCGYTSAWDILASELKLRFHLPEFPLMHVGSVVASLRTGVAFDEASAVDCVARCEKPMMFIHGTADDFVPFEMMEEVYEAKVLGDKEKLVVEGAGHNNAWKVLGDEYFERCFAFIDCYLGE